MVEDEVVGIDTGVGPDETGVCWVSEGVVEGKNVVVSREEILRRFGHLLSDDCSKMFRNLSPAMYAVWGKIGQGVMIAPVSEVDEGSKG